MAEWLSSRVAGCIVIVGGQMTNAIVKNQLELFVLANIDKPSFDAQMKEQLTSRASEFGTKPKCHKYTVSASMQCHKYTVSASTPCKIVTHKQNCRTFPAPHAHLSLIVSMEGVHNYQSHGTTCHSIMSIST